MRQSSKEKQRKSQKPQLDAARSSGKIALIRGNKFIIKNETNTSLASSNASGTPPAQRKPISNVFSPRNLANANASSLNQQTSDASDELPSPMNLRPRLLSQSKINKG